MNKNYEILLDEYIAHNGKHFNETLARRIVSDMWHKDSEGKKIVGEVITPDEAMKLIDAVDAEKYKEMRWDAYVAANAFMHDLAKSEITKGEIMKAAKCFWFHDDDIGEKHNKVFGYFFK